MISLKLSLLFFYFRFLCWRCDCNAFSWHSCTVHRLVFSILCLWYVTFLYSELNEKCMGWKKSSCRHWDTSVSTHVFTHLNNPFLIFWEQRKHFFCVIFPTLLPLVLKSSLIIYGNFVLHEIYYMSLIMKNKVN